MALREVGLYAWTLPHVKDPVGSTLRIMKRPSEKRSGELVELIFRVQPTAPRSQFAHIPQRPNGESPIVQLMSQVPDPSRTTIQHHLQKARLAAGQDGYIVVLYTGHGIQEPPTEAGELWCYDLSFEDCAQQGTNPSEYALLT